jgi:protein SCO1
MARPRTTPASDDESARILDGGFWLVLGMAGICGLLVVLSVVRGLASSGTDGSSTPTSSLAAVDPNAYLVQPVRPAPPLSLTDQTAQPFQLADLRGSPTFVFFGYTHCPDVCPATIGTIGLAMADVGPGPRAVFVTVDPARDTPEWLTEYIRFLPAGFVGLTGTDARIADAATAWGVKYARVDTGVSDGYAMSHTADVFLVDSAGDLRARFPFGTTDKAMAATLRAVIAHPIAAVSGAPTEPAPSSPGAASATLGPARSEPAGRLGIVVKSSSIWSGAAAPVILALTDDGVPLADTSLRPSVQLTTASGEPAGAPVAAVAVQPPGVAAVSYVASVPIPASGSWRLTVTAGSTTGPASNSVVITALDPGTTPAIGGPAPTAHTPTLDDVGGVARAVTTDPAPDLRLSQRSTTDALADRQPFVLVADSTRFRVSPACGRAIVMARYLVDRWPDVAFIHLEPYVYDVVTDTAVLRGSLDDPTLTAPADAWGIGGAPWGARSMPWIFVVDGKGIVRATFQGVIGSDEVDVIVSLIAQGG